MRFRKPHRIPEFDYSSAASYFITFNTINRQKLLSEIHSVDAYVPPVVSLKPYGEITEKYILQMEAFHPEITLDNYVIMPDHVHLLITIKESDEANPGIAVIIQSLKTMITKEIGNKIWQLDFYDTVADTDELFMRCDTYIDNNPAVWLDRAGMEPPAPK